MSWDGYKQQEAIIIDDFDNTIPYRTLLRMLDRYGQVNDGYEKLKSNQQSIYIYILRAKIRPVITGIAMTSHKSSASFNLKNAVYSRL